MKVLDPSTLSFAAAADALEAALAGGLDPEAGPPRMSLPVGEGELLVMPAAAGPVAAVKLVSVGPVEPRIQGVCVLFDAATLAPVALVDGIALTNLRTAAVSLLAVRHLAPRRSTARDLRPRPPGACPRRGARDRARRRCSAATTRAATSWSPPPTSSAAAPPRASRCSTATSSPTMPAWWRSARTSRPRARPTTGSPRAPPSSSSRATSALREAGDVIGAIEAGVLEADELVTLRDLVAGADLPPGPRLFKSTGMAWEDAVVAGALYG